MPYEVPTLSSSAALPCAAVLATILACSMKKRSADEAALSTERVALRRESEVRGPAARSTGQNVAATAAQPQAGQAMDYSNRARAPMVAVLTTDDFRTAAQNLVGPADVVLEVGCADGITTNLIHKYAADVVGIDTAAGVIAKAKQRYPTVDFRQMDGTDLEAVQQLRPSFDKVFVDIAGVISLEALLPMLARLDDALQPGLVVVKSKALAKLQNQLQRGAMALKKTEQPVSLGMSSIRPAAGANANAIDEVTTQLHPVEVQRGRTVPVTRVLRLSGAVDEFLRVHGLRHGIKTAETEWPYASQKPPTNPATRHAACGVPAADVIKCWFVAVERSEIDGESRGGGDALHFDSSSVGEGSAGDNAKSNSADDWRVRSSSGTSPCELVWLVAAGSATVNLAAVAGALGIEDTSRVRLANRQQLSTSSLCGVNGRETDLVYASKKFRLCPPLVGLPAPVDVVVMSELLTENFDGNDSTNEDRHQQPLQRAARRHYVEVGFGRYAILGQEELRQALHIAATGLPTQESGSADASAQSGGASPRGRVLEVPGLQAATSQRGQILC